MRDDRIVEKGGHKFIKLKSGRMMTFWDAYSEAKTARTTLATATSRMFRLEGPYDFDWLERHVDKLEEYVSALRAHLNTMKSEQAQRERIGKLRNTTGRTPEEAAEFLKKADELEAAINGK